MKRSIITVCATMTVVLSLSGVANAEIVQYKFSFTGADLMNYVTADGIDDSSAADNGLFDGARLVRDIPGYTRSYVASQNSDFTTWATTTTDRFIGFNLWGFNGLGANWGDDHKPDSWGAMTESSGWTNWTATWPWGSPPAGYRTDVLVGWDADSYADGLNFGDGDLASKEFSFVVNFETTDMWWGQDTQGAPNTLPELTFWFGGWFDDDYWGGGDDPDYYGYEGNMVLEGQMIPAPGAALLGVMGLGLVGWVKRRFA